MPQHRTHRHYWRPREPARRCEHDE
jgi:hypothetical protein